MYNKQDIRLWICNTLGSATDHEVREYLIKSENILCREVIDLAIHEGVSTYLWARLEDRQLTDLVPSEAAPKFKQLAQQILLKNLKFVSALTRAVNELTQDEIPVLVLKGAGLLEGIYGHYALRPMSDVDLLVRRQDYNRIAQVFYRLGYNSDSPDAEELKRPFRNEVKFVSYKSHLHFDLHFHLTGVFSPFKFDLDRIWQRSVKSTIQGTDIRLMAPEDHFLFLCYHTAFRHSFNQLKHILDLHLILTSSPQPLVPEVLWQRAREWNMSRSLALSLAVVRELFKTDVEKYLPEQQLELLLPQTQLASSIMQILQGTTDELLEFSTVATFMTQSGWRNKLRFLRRCLSYPASKSLPAVSDGGVNGESSEENLSRTGISRRQRTAGLILKYSKFVRKNSPSAWNKFRWYLKQQRWLAG